MRAVLLVLDVDVGLAEHDEQVALAGVLELVGHVQVGVHLGLEDRQRAELGELGSVRVEIEGAGDQHVEARFGGLAGGGDEIDARDGAEFRPHEDAGAALGLAFGRSALGADIFARPALQRGEPDCYSACNFDPLSGGIGVQN